MDRSISLFSASSAVPLGQFCFGTLVTEGLTGTLTLVNYIVSIAFAVLGCYFRLAGFHTHPANLHGPTLVLHSCRRVIPPAAESTPLLALARSPI